MRDLAGSAWGRSGWSIPQLLRLVAQQTPARAPRQEKPSTELGTRLQRGPRLEPAAPSSRSISPPFLPALDAALHVRLVTAREMKFFLLNLAQADLQCQGSFPAAGFPDLLDGPLGGWKCSALTSTLIHRRCDYPNAARLLSRHYAPLLMGFSI